MADKLSGQWETDQEHGKNENFKKYHTAIGLGADVVDQFSKVRDALEYEINGTKMTCKVLIGGKVIKTYDDIEEGKEVSIEGVDGKPCLFCYRIKNGKWVETYKPGDGKGIEVETTKVVNGNKLTITHNIVGKDIAYTYTATKK
ncbi:uncharacterized protein LOC117335913 [Pecten maximus]|uniref:uncharacterized protein LOC117335913 n=1 Tax=Pecten maximus TaxID=6579 RepID=UPI0014586916|nr:uncharacterized protein LOC117335913 [Pecten maximus]